MNISTEFVYLLWLKRQKILVNFFKFSLKSSVLEIFKPLYHQMTELNKKQDSFFKVVLEIQYNVDLG
jgi:hypothetical protein